MDLYKWIYIKQVFSAFADHDPLLLSALAILENVIWGWY